MHPRLLRHYEDELRHLREVGTEFAAEYPKIAGRLALEKFECADPYVERLLEGFAFLNARTALKLEARFPRFTNHLLETVYPHYLAPTPSMAVVQFNPETTEGALANGFTIPREETVLRSVALKGNPVSCEFRTGHDVTLWPIEVSKADYLPTAGAAAALGVPTPRGVRACLRLRLKATAGLKINQLSLDRLPIFLNGDGGVPDALQEQILATTLTVVIRPASKPNNYVELPARDAVRRVGFTEDEALLPVMPRSFDGYRLLHEYFAFPQRYRFVELTGLGPSVKRCAEEELEIILLFSRANPRLEGLVDAGAFALFCAPIVNLFPKRLDRVHISAAEEEFHVVPDRTRPRDFEIHTVTAVEGFGANMETAIEFRPFHSLRDRHMEGGSRAFYAVSRTPRVLSAKERLTGPRSSYVGSEVRISLVDPDEAPFSHDLRQLGVAALCTNRDLPLRMPVGRSNTDFTMDIGAPVQSIRCLAGPTKPRPTPGEGETAWRLISHLSLNYLSLTESDPVRGAAAARELLSLYAALGDPTIVKRAEGLRHMKTSPIVRRVPHVGAVVHARGVQIDLTLDEHVFEGGGVFGLGAVLEEFFAKHVTINSFTETVLHTVDRGEITRWPARLGRREII